MALRLLGVVSRQYLIGDGAGSCAHGGAPDDRGAGDLASREPGEAEGRFGKHLMMARKLSPGVGADDPDLGGMMSGRRGNFH